MIHPLNQSEAVTSLLSLSIASSSPVMSANASTTTTATTTASGKHHRRLGSTGKARRRLSDAREASARPSFAPSSAPLSSVLSSLSLSTSPGSSTSYSGGCKPLAPKPSTNGGITILSNSSSNPVPVHDATQPQEDPTYPSSTNLKPGKKRGIDYRCESCSKIYRHPNCLNKHRWEHTKQWREASKFVSSKHQQVQLLEAATILSYMGSSCSTSLPEDRSEWPTFLSGGVLPKVGVEEVEQEEGQGSISSSVPTGPRMHDYALGKGAVTQLRPGLLGVLTASEVNEESPQNPSGASVYTQQYPTSMSVPMGMGMGYTHAPFSGSFSYGSYGSYGYAPYGAVPTRASAVAPAKAQGEEAEIDVDIDDSNEAEEMGWSLPASSLRSAPSLISSSRSRSGSGSGTGSLGDPTPARGRSGSDDEGEEEDDQIQIRVEMEGDLEHMDGVESRHYAPRKVHSLDRYPGQLNEEEGDDIPPPISLTMRDTSTTRAIPRSLHGHGRLSHPSSPTTTRHSHSRSRSSGYPTSSSFGRRGVGMKREDDDSSFLSGGFSVREEPEPERDDIDSREGGGRWDGLEMDVDMDMD